MFHPSSKAFPSICYTYVFLQTVIESSHNNLILSSIRARFQSKPSPYSPFLDPLWKAKWLEVDLKLTIAKETPKKNQPSHPKAPPIPNRTFLNPQSLGHFISIKGSGSLSHSLQTGSPVCSVALCVISLAVDRSCKGVSCDNRITQVETRAGVGDR